MFLLKLRRVWLLATSSALACSGEDASPLQSSDAGRRGDADAHAAAGPGAAPDARVREVDAGDAAMVDAGVHVRDGGLGELPWQACVPDSVHVFGTLEGRSIDLVRPTYSHNVGATAVYVSFGIDGAARYASASAAFLSEPTAHAPTEAITSTLRLEAPDPYAGRDLCGGRSTVGYRDGDKVLVVMERVSSVTCPGTPVSGRLVLEDKRLNGELDGHTYRETGTNQGACLGAGWTDPEGCQGVDLDDNAQLNLTTEDDLPSMGRRGSITGGRMTLRDPSGRETGIYCVGGGAPFTRAADDLLDMTVTLDSFSSAGSCDGNEALGSLTFCLQDSALASP
jgi:hypothetical protein